MGKNTPASINEYLQVDCVCVCVCDEKPVTQQASGRGGHTSTVAGKEEIIPVCVCVCVFKNRDYAL